MKLSRHVAWIVVAVAGSLWWLAGRPVASAAAEDPRWLTEPSQEDTDREPIVVETRRGAVTLVPRAAYDVAAVVRGSERYRLDRSAFLSPLDLALAWGEAATPAVRRRVSVFQGARFFTWSTRDGSLDLTALAHQQANVHLVPATPNLRRALLGVGEGDVVRLRGLLVDAAGPDGFRWSTSLTRTDDGDGSCELLWVEELQVGRRLYR
jgi:hypothetical protein